MSSIISIVLIGLVFWAATWVIRRALEQLPAATPYKRGQGVLSPAEKVFFLSLRLAVGDRYEVFPKVRVADVLTPAASGRAWRIAFSRITGKHFDFVLCTKPSLEVVAVVELDDSTHQRTRRIDRDQFLGEACSRASLPLVRFPVARSYQPAAIRQAIVSALEPTDVPTAGRIAPRVA